MKIAMALVSLMIGFAAQADIPNNGKSIQTYTYDGAEAEAKFNSIEKVAGQNFLWVSVIVYKVERSENGLEQTVCTSSSNRLNKTTPAHYECTESKSLNGQPLPVFKVPLMQG